MSQRQLRLGDILDDYCPRERRLTNHVIVAMVDDDIKQTRCTTCEAEHEYKRARIPPQRRKKDAPGALYQDVLAGMPRKTGPSSSTLDPTGSTDLPPDSDEAAAAEEPIAALPADLEDDGEEQGERADEPAEEGPVHRPLIRATLPRPEGQPPSRQAPEFTMRQPQPARPGRFRPARPQRGTPGGDFRFNGWRGKPVSPEAARQAHGNRARPAQPDQRQGQSRRRGKRRPK